MLQLAFERPFAWNPGDCGAAPLHAAKPGHLTFGKLPDGNVEPFKHLVVGGLAKQMLGEVLVLKASVGEAFGLKTRI